MNKNIVSSRIQWEKYELTATGGSMIVASNHRSICSTGLSPQQLPKKGLNDLYRQKMLNRYPSQNEINPHHRLLPSQPISLSPQMPQEKKQRSPMPVQNQQKKAYWEPFNRGRSRQNNKETMAKPEKVERRFNNRLKETASTTSTEQLLTYKSEKALPTFVRHHVFSPHKFKAKGSRLSKDDFKFIKVLGEGKFGTVNLVQQIHTGMIVALKAISKKRIVEDKMTGQFIRQLKIQSFLDHPNISKIYGYFTDADYFYIMMELGCDGQLFDVISSGQTLSEESTSFIIGNLLDAINLMHRHKIIHRDIKPENIVIVHGNIKLCDFGWAVNKKQELRATFCGTPLYLSPQLLQGARYDEKVDLWAIGVLAFELHLGCSPFDINEQQDLVKIVTDQIKFPQNRYVSGYFKDFINAILKKNPKERIPSQDLMNFQFIRKYRDLQTCEELCH